MIRTILVGVGMPIEKLRKGASIEYKPTFRIGALTPNFDIDHCISVEYFVQLEIGFNRRPHKITALSIQLPIIIGTIPIMTIGRNQSLQLLISKAIAENGDDAAASFPLQPPPSYDMPIIDDRGE